MADEWRVTILGTAEAKRAFETRRGRIIPILRPVFMDAGRSARDELKDYPRQPSRSRYVRTGTLGRRWEIRPINRPGVIGANVYNTTEYGGYVQSKLRQVAWLSHWTNTDYNVARGIAPDLIRNVSGALVRGFR